MTTPSASRRIAGIDVGGTFTDLIVVDDATGEVRIAKVPTTVDNQAFGVLAAIAAAGVAPGSLDAIVHGTTTTTNAMLERKIATVGLITTRGFRDVLELGRRTRPKPYGLKGRFVPLIERHLRLEVDERMDAEGRVLVAARRRRRRRQRRCSCWRSASRASSSTSCTAISIQPRGARRRDRARLWPNRYVTVGHTVVAEQREYERGTTAAVNAAIQPVLHRYIDRLQTELAGRGFARELLVMQGNGGTVSASVVTEHAVATVMSGPASGVIAAAATAMQAGSRPGEFANVVSYDMGGTSSDVALVLGGMPQVASDLELEYATADPRADGRRSHHRRRRRLDRLGRRVGNAARRPGKRGRRAGADLLRARRPAGHDHRRQHRPRPPRSRPAALGRARGLARRDPRRDRRAGRRVARARCDRGSGSDRPRRQRQDGRRDPHGEPRARPRPARLRPLRIRRRRAAARRGARAELAIPKLLIPARPGLTNALGCVVADLRHDFVATVNQPLESLAEGRIAEVFAAQIAAGEALVARENVAVEEVVTLHRADMQFQGQSHILPVAIDATSITVAALRELFAAAYWKRFGVALPEIRPVLVNLHTAVIGKRKQVSLRAIAAAQPATTLAEARRTTRPVWFADGGWRETPIYVRERLPIAARFEGPAIVEQLDCTTVVEPGQRVEVDPLGNLIVSV